MRVSKYVVFVELLFIGLSVLLSQQVNYKYKQEDIVSLEKQLNSVEGYGRSTLTINTQEDEYSYYIVGKYKELLNYKLLENLEKGEQIIVSYSTKEPWISYFDKLSSRKRLMGLVDREGQVILSSREYIQYSNKEEGIFYKILEYLIIYSLVVLIGVSWILYFLVKLNYSKYSNLINHPLLSYKLVKEDKIP